jgi:hypothetical protein
MHNYNINEVSKDEQFFTSPHQPLLIISANYFEFTYCV